MWKNAVYYDQRKWTIFKNSISWCTTKFCTWTSLIYPILFISNMHNSVECCKVHHYVNDTNLLLTDNSLKKKTSKPWSFFIMPLAYGKKINLNQQDRNYNFPTKKYTNKKSKNQHINKCQISFALPSDIPMHAKVGVKALIHWIKCKHCKLQLLE